MVAKALKKRGKNVGRWIPISALNKVKYALVRYFCSDNNEL